MTLPGSTHWIVALVLDRMVYSLVAGTALVAIVTVALRLTPQKNSQTRFAVWFAALLAVLALPFLGAEWGARVANLTPHNALVIIPESWALILLCGWVVVAGAGVIRLVAGLWQVRRLRVGCTEISPRLLGPELQKAIDEVRRSRPVSILISPRLEVPTAIGFLRPAVVIPAWLADEMTSEDLQYVILHELAHLRRRDDWTNLVQKLVKAVLFFHPAVFWIERKLSLDREMACDDAVLAQTSSARVYALCLARVAEKGLARRGQLVLVQAAVDRVRQLSLRVAQILNEDRPRSRRLWKPAIPMVTAAALLCALMASQVPRLVGLGGVPQRAKSASTVATQMQAGNLGDGLKTTDGRSPGVGVSPAWLVPASYTPASMKFRQRKHSAARMQSARRAPQASTTRLVATRDSIVEDGGGTSPAPASDDRGAVLVVVMTRAQVISAGSQLWQVQTVELHWVVPEVRNAKPIPRKT
jgi:beta-lactamase regulating signal transducer with metallopeptidase domain